jgi:hypothetical protein
MSMKNSSDTRNIERLPEKINWTEVAAVVAVMTVMTSN